VTNKKKPKQWRWAENDFPNRDIDYEVKIHKDEALPLIENWYLGLLTPPPPLFRSLPTGAKPRRNCSLCAATLFASWPHVTHRFGPHT
jgi:hypothetical protein